MFGGIGNLVQSALPQIMDCIPPSVKEKALDMGKDLAMNVGQSLMEEAGKQLEQIGVKMQGTDISKLFDVGQNMLEGMLPKPFGCFPEMLPQLPNLPNLNLDQFMPKPSMNFDFGPEINVTINITINEALSQMPELANIPGFSLDDVKQVFGDMINQLMSSVAENSSPASDLPILTGTKSADAGSIDKASGGETISKAGGSEKADKAGGAEKTDKSSGTEKTDKSSGAGSTDKADGAEKEYKFDKTMLDPAAMDRLRRTDPEAYMEKLDAMDPKDRGMVMQNMQQHLQEINQMFSMMSNFAKSEHDTMKAIIGNMRV